MSNAINHLYEFGEFRADPARRLLLRNDEVIPMTPKVFDTLLVLLESSGQVLEKDELIRQVWGGVAVEEVGLTKNVSALRRALGESPGEHRFIVTEPGRGYRFVASVRTVPASSESIEEAVIETHTVSRIITDEEVSEPAASGLLSRARSGRRGAAIFFGILLAVGAGVFFYFRSRPALTDRDTILIADFINQTGDGVFDLTLREGLAAQLEQSPFLNVLPEQQIREALREMRLSPDQTVMSDIAREICQRQGLKAWITGIIAPLGKHYALTIEATDSRTGETLARVQQEAASKEDVLRTLSLSASRLRGKLGESLRSIQRFDSLLPATTSSLEALQAYSLGQKEGRIPSHRQEAIRYFQHAIDLDPQFAGAYSALGVLYNNAREPGRAAEYGTKAYQLRDHSSEDEKLTIMSRYYGEVTGELYKRIEVLKIQEQSFPRDPVSYSNLAATYNALGRFEEAIPQSRVSLRISPAIEARFAVLGNSLVRLNRLDEATEVYRQAAEFHLDSPSFHQGLFRIAFLKGDKAGIEQQVAWATQKGLADNALDWQAGAAAALGEWKRSAELTRKSLDEVRGADNAVVAGTYAAQAGLRGAALGKCEGVKAAASQALQIERNQVTLPRSALALGWCGDAKGAESVLADMTRQYPVNTVLNSIWAPTIRAAIAMKRGDAAVAMAALQPVEQCEAAAEFWPQYLRGVALLSLGKSSEAETQFRKILDHRGQDPLSPLYLQASFELARAAEARHDPEEGRRRYSALLSAWHGADADLPALVQARMAKKRLE